MFGVPIKTLCLFSSPPVSKAGDLVKDLGFGGAFMDNRVTSLLFFGWEKQFAVTVCKEIRAIM